MVLKDPYLGIYHARTPSPDGAEGCWGMCRDRSQGSRHRSSLREPNQGFVRGVAAPDHLRTEAHDRTLCGRWPPLANLLRRSLDICDRRFRARVEGTAGFLDGTGVSEEDSARRFSRPPRKSIRGGKLARRSES